MVGEGVPEAEVLILRREGTILSLLYGGRGVCFENYLFFSEAIGKFYVPAAKNTFAVNSFSQTP